MRNAILGNHLNLCCAPKVRHVSRLYPGAAYNRNIFFVCREIGYNRGSILRYTLKMPNIPKIKTLTPMALVFRFHLLFISRLIQCAFAVHDWLTAKCHELEAIRSINGVNNFIFLFFFKENYRMGGKFVWPSVSEVAEYRKIVRQVILNIIENTPLELPVTQESKWVWSISCILLRLVFMEESYKDNTKVGIRTKWPIRSELILAYPVVCGDYNHGHKCWKKYAPFRSPSSMLF